MLRLSRGTAISLLCFLALTGLAAVGLTGQSPRTEAGGAIAAAQCADCITAADPSNDPSASETETPVSAGEAANAPTSAPYIECVTHCPMHADPNAGTGITVISVQQTTTFPGNGGTGQVTTVNGTPVTAPTTPGGIAPAPVGPNEAPDGQVAPR